MSRQIESNCEGVASLLLVVSVSGVESSARAAGEGSSDLVLAGYAAVFDVEANMYPGCVEVFRKGAFAETLQRDEIRAYWCHEDSMVLARTSSGTLSLSEDEIGRAHV